MWRIDAVARAILRAGATELEQRRDIPTAVVIDEYVEIAKAFFEGPEPAFINAALDACVVGLVAQARDRLRLALQIDDPRTAEDLQAPPVGIVDQEQRDAVVGHQIADRHVLAVAAVIGEAERAVVEQLEKAGRSAAVLDVGPAGFRNGCHVEAVARRDERALAFAETVLRRRIWLFEALIRAARALPLLHGLDGRREHQFREAVRHRCFLKGAAARRSESRAASLSGSSWATFRFTRR